MQDGPRLLYIVRECLRLLIPANILLEEKPRSPPASLRWRGIRRFEAIKGSNHMAKKRKAKKTKIKRKRTAKKNKPKKRSTSDLSRLSLGRVRAKRAASQE